MTSRRSPWRRRVAGMSLVAVVILVASVRADRPAVNLTIRLSGTATTSGGVGATSSAAASGANSVTMASAGLQTMGGSVAPDLYPGARVNLMLSVHNSR